MTNSKKLSARVVAMIRKGRSNKYISAKTGLSTPSIAAFRANETRGTYGW